MAKQKKKLYEPFESSNTNGKFHKLADDMIKSKAWKEMTLIEKALYYEFKFKYTKHRDGTDNKNDLSMPKSEYTKLMNDRTFGKAIDRLIDLGFIKVIECRWTTRECTIYGFSEQWKYYGTDKFNVTDKDRRVKRKLSESHRENVIKALEKTNLNRQ